MENEPQTTNTSITRFDGNKLPSLTKQKPTTEEITSAVVKNIGTCEQCGNTKASLVFSNNPLLPNPKLCYHCINEMLDYNNLEQADFFCRTFNIPFDPSTWISSAKEFGDDVWRQYTKLQLEEIDSNKPNLTYTSSTKDLWAKTNKEWAKCRSFAEILAKLEEVREPYITRGRLKWGDNYTFEELIKLDSVYTRTLRANRITNPLQKEAVKTLCKLNIEVDAAIRSGDTKSMKDLSASYAAFSKQADLETMIAETKTEDVTTLSEFVKVLEDKGYVMKYYDGVCRDQIDFAIKDIQDATRRCILESTGLQSTLDQMIEQRKRANEEMAFQNTAEQDQSKLKELLDYQPEDDEIATENDEDAINQDFSLEEDSETQEEARAPIKVVTNSDADQ